MSTVFYEFDTGRYHGLDAGVDTDIPIVRVTSLKLTDAQIKALPTTPLVVVAAPGTGKYIVPIFNIIETDFSNGFYSNVTDGSTTQGATDFVVTYGQNAVNAFRAVPINYFAGTFTAQRVAFSLPYQTLSAPAIAADQVWAQALSFPFNGSDHVENNALYISADNGAGNFTGGGSGNFMNVVVYYLIRTYGAA